MWFEQRQRIQGHAAAEKAEVEVRPGDAPRRAGKGERVAGFHFLAGFDEVLRQMEIDGQHAAAMIHVNGAAGKIMRTFKHDRAVGDRRDRRADGGAQVEAAMK